MEFENIQNNLEFNQNNNDYQLENNENELLISNEKPQASFDNEENQLSFDAPYTPTSGSNNYEELDNLPSINNVPLIGNKTTEELGIEADNNYNNASNKPKINDVELKGNLKTEDLKLLYEKLLNLPKINGVELIGNKTLEELGIILGGGGLKELELSLDFENPTYLPDLETGTYLIKNTGVTCTYEKGVLDNVISANQLLTIVNLRDIFIIAGEEVSDEDNVTWIYVKGLEIGTYIKYGLEDWVFAYDINSLNVNDYIDTSGFLSENNISQGYGIKFENGILQPVIADTPDINNQAMGRMISASNVKYAVQKWERGAPVLLWKNPNPNVAMKETYITLSTINYDKYEVIYRDNITNNYYNSNVSFKHKGTILINENDVRIINPETSVNLIIENATNDNSNLVPVYILGYNFGLLS